MVLSGCTNINEVSKKLIKINSTKESNYSSPVLNTQPFSLWKIVVESCSNANWIEIGTQAFKQQLAVLLITIVAASFLGFIKFDNLKL